MIPDAARERSFREREVNLLKREKDALDFIKGNLVGAVRKRLPGILVGFHEKTIHSGSHGGACQDGSELSGLKGGTPLFQEKGEE